MKVKIVRGMLDTDINAEAYRKRLQQAYDEIEQEALLQNGVMGLLIANMHQWDHHISEILAYSIAKVTLKEPLN